MVGVSFVSGHHGPASFAIQMLRTPEMMTAIKLGISPKLWPAMMISARVLNRAM
jgi:hypothetical protein